MLRLSLLFFLMLPSICHGQMFLMQNIKNFGTRTMVIVEEQDVQKSEGNVLYVYLNKAYPDKPEYKLIKDIFNEDFSREKVRIGLQIDSGLLARSQSSEELNRVKSKWEEIKRNVKLVETKHHVSPCFNHSKYSDRVYDIGGNFHNIDGSVEKIQYPSQIIEKLFLEIYLVNYYRNNYHTNEPFILYNWSNTDKIINVKNDVYSCGHETVRFSYINLDFLKRKIPVDRVIIHNIQDDFGNVSSIKNKTRFISDEDKYKLYIKYIKYLHNNTSMDYSEDIINFEESLLRKTTKVIYPV